jgi:hypothetical protein
VNGLLVTFLAGRKASRNGPTRCAWPARDSGAFEGGCTAPLCCISAMDRLVLQSGFASSNLRAGGGFKLAGNTSPRAKLPAHLPSLPERQPKQIAIREPHFIGELVARAHALQRNGDAASVSRLPASPAATACKAHQVDIDFSSVAQLTPRRPHLLHAESMIDRDASVQPAGGNGSPRHLCEVATASVSPLREAPRSPRRGTVGPPGMAALELVGAFTQPTPRPQPAGRAGTAAGSSKEASPRRSIFSRSLFEPSHVEPGIRVYESGPPRGPTIYSSDSPQVAASSVPFPSRRHARHLAEIAKPAGQIGLSRPDPAPPIGRDVSAYAHVSTR